MAVDLEQLKKDVEEAKRLRGQERARKSLGDVGKNYFRRKAGWDEKTSATDPDLDDDLKRKQKLLDEKSGLSGGDDFKVSDKYVGENDEILYTKKGEPGFFLADKTAYTGKTKRYEKKKEEKVKEMKHMVGWTVDKAIGAQVYRKGTAWYVQIGAGEPVPYDPAVHGKLIDEKGQVQKDIAKSNQDIREQNQKFMTTKELDKQVKTFKDGIKQTQVPGIVESLKTIKGILSKIQPGKDIPGVGQISNLFSKIGIITEKGSKIKAAFEKLFSLELKNLSGAAASDSEVNRVRLQFQQGAFNNDKEFLNGIELYLKALQANFNNEIAGVNPGAVKEYYKRNPGGNYQTQIGGLLGFFTKYRKAYIHVIDPSDKQEETEIKTNKPRKITKKNAVSGDIIKGKNGKFYVKKPNGKWKSFINLSDAQVYSKKIKDGKV